MRSPSGPQGRVLRSFAHLFAYCSGCLTICREQLRRSIVAEQLFVRFRHGNVEGGPPTTANAGIAGNAAARQMHLTAERARARRA